MLGLTEFQNSFADAFCGKFIGDSDYKIKCSYNTLETKKLLHTWVEIFSTSSVPKSIHTFSVKDKAVHYLIERGKSREEQIINFDHHQGFARIIGSPQSYYILAIYDDKGKLITDSFTCEYSYILMGAYNESLVNLSNHPIWLLGKSGVPNNVAQELLSSIKQAIGETRDSPVSNSTHRVDWNVDDFTSSRTIHLKLGDKINFISTDKHPHNVVESDSRWFPLEDMYLLSTPCINLNETICPKEAGAYYFICPRYPRIMRLKIIVKDDQIDLLEKLLN